MIKTVDANVFVSAALATDVHHVESSEFLTSLRRQPEKLICPSLLLVETVASIARVTGDPKLGHREFGVIRRFPGMKLVGLTLGLARRASVLAATLRLRGADSIYAAVAAEHGATLITWDLELLTRGASAIPTMTPSDWLQRNK